MFPNSRMLQPDNTSFAYASAPFFGQANAFNNGNYYGGGYNGFRGNTNNNSYNVPAGCAGGNGETSTTGSSDARSQTPSTPPETGETQPINTTLVEVGAYNDGTLDEHAQEVMDVYQQHDPNSTLNVVGVGLDNPNAQAADDAGSQMPQLQDKQALDDYIDQESSSALNIMSDKISELDQANETNVVNASLGYSRNNVYENVTLALAENPQLANTVGLQESDLSNLETNENGQILIDAQVSKAVVDYVDSRMDQSGSAYQQSLQNYQQTTQQAANDGMMIVVAGGNEHDLNDAFPSHGLGSDTNMLTLSDSVISAAASDDKGTANPQDDTMADFSSYGDGRYNPTVSADGVDVKTNNGEVDGTSFSAPQVSAAVARMLQANPNLTFDQVKGILQGTATDLIPNSQVADGAGIMNPNQALLAVRQLPQTA